MSVKVQENRVRRVAQRQGLQLVKSRRRDTRALDFGGYWLIRVENDSGHWRSREMVAGGDHGCSLDEIEMALNK